MRRAHRFDLEREPGNFCDAHARPYRDRFAVVRRGAPELAMNENHSGGGVHGLRDFAFFANQLFLAGGQFPRARAQDEPRQNGHNHRERNGHRERGPSAYAHARKRRFNEKHRSQKHGDYASQTKHTMRGEFSFQNK